VELEGKVEVWRRTSVGGWVRRSEAQAERLRVCAVVDGTCIAETIANIFRPDLADAAVGDGFHGFHLAFDPPPPEGAWVELRVGEEPDYALLGAGDTFDEASVEGSVDSISPRFVWSSRRSRMAGASRGRPRACIAPT